MDYTCRKITLNISAIHFLVENIKKKIEIESFERKKMLTSPKLTLRKASQAFFFSSTWSLLLLCHIRSIMNVTFSTTKMAKMCKCANCKTFFLN